MVYPDFVNAFDNVDHGILLPKAKQRHYTLLPYSDREQRVAVDCAMSQASAVNSEVTQGSVLGPLLV